MNKKSRSPRKPTAPSDPKSKEFVDSEDSSDQGDIKFGNRQDSDESGSSSGSLSEEIKQNSDESEASIEKSEEIKIEPERTSTKKKPDTQNKEESENSNPVTPEKVPTESSGDEQETMDFKTSSSSEEVTRRNTRGSARLAGLRSKK